MREGHCGRAATAARMLLQEELRALRTAVQLMLKRREDTARPSAPAMEAIEEGSREAEADSDPVAEEAAAGGAVQAAGADAPSGVIHIANSTEVDTNSPRSSLPAQHDMPCAGLIASRMPSHDMN